MKTGRGREFRFDGAKEYNTDTLQKLAREYQFTIKIASRYVHENQGRVERAHQTIDNMSRAMCKTAGLPISKFWYLADEVAIYIENRIVAPSSTDGKSPYERRYGHKPNLQRLRTFGCAAFPFIHEEQRRNKHNDRAGIGIFVGYADAGYKVLDPTTMQIHTEGIVDFDESQFPGQHIDWSSYGDADTDSDYQEESETPKQIDKTV